MKQLKSQYSINRYDSLTTDVTSLFESSVRIKSLTSDKEFYSEYDALVLKCIEEICEECHINKDVQGTLQEFYCTCLVKNDIMNLMVDEVQYEIDNIKILLNLLKGNRLI